MSEIKVRRVTLSELSRRQILHIALESKGQLIKFVATYDQGAKELLVDKSIPEEDVRMFVEIVSYEGLYINDKELCEISDTVDAVYGKYGPDVYLALLGGYKSRMQERVKAEAKDRAEEACPKIKAYLESEEGASFLYDNEDFLYYVASKGTESNLRTAHNKIGYRTAYVYALGFLTGKGEI